MNKKQGASPASRPRSRGRVVILSGPSGSGKTTLHDLLLKSPAFSGRLVRSISATTRAPRGDEKQGREYLFLSRKMFESKVRRGHFLEWARVFDRYYGTPLKNVREILKSGRSVLLCIDVQGGRQVKRAIPGAITIFISPPDMKELGRRLASRGTDSPENVALRLKTAAAEMKEARHYDHVIVNDDLARAKARLEQILAPEIA